MTNTWKRISMAVLFCAGSAMMLGAADAPKADAAKVISAEMRARFWRTEAELTAAAARAEKAAAAKDSVIAEMSAACGGLKLVAGPDGEPTCAEPPRAATGEKPQPPDK